MSLRAGFPWHLASADLAAGVRLAGCQLGTLGVIGLAVTYLQDWASVK